MQPFNPATIAFPLYTPPLTEDEAKKLGGIQHGYPILVWEERFNTDRKPWEEMVHRLMDTLAQKTVTRTGTGLNPHSNYDLYYGNIDQNSKEVRRVTEANGGPANADYKPYFFFSTNINRLVGSVLTTSSHFSLEIINTEAALDKIDKDSEMGAEHFMRQIGDEIENEVGAGVGKSLTNPDEVVPSQAEEIFNKVSQKERHAILVNDLLTYSLETYDAKRELANCYRDGCIIGEEWGEVVLTNSDPKFERRDPKTTGWIGPDMPQNAEECDAIGFFNKKTYGAVFHKWGKELGGGRKEDLEKAMAAVARGSMGGTNGDMPIKNQSDMSRYEDSIYASSFYRKVGNDWMVAEHTGYFKVIHPIRVDLLRGGKALSKSEFEDYNNKRFDYAEEVTYVINEDGVEKDNTKTIYKVEWWKAVRLGHRTLVHLSRTESQYSDPNDPANSKCPVVGYVNPDPCLVTLGADLCKQHWNLMFTIKKLVAMTGVRSIAYDEAQLPKDMTLADVAYTSKEGGLTLYNSTNIQGDENRTSSRHLTPVDWSLTDDIGKLVELATFIQNEYNQLCGVNESMRGNIASRQGNGATELALQQGDLIQRPSFYLHQRLEANGLLAMANIGKRLWAANPGHRILISPAFGRKLLKITKDISLQAYGIIMKDAYAAEQDRQFLMGMIDRLASTGSISLGDILTMYDEKNVSRVRALIKDGLSAKERVDAQLQQQTQQIQAQANQIKAQEQQDKVAMNTQDNQTKVRVAEIQVGAKQEIHTQSIQHKEDAIDVQNSNVLQQKAADNFYASQQAEAGQLTS